MLRRGGIWTVRVHVPVVLRPLIGQREVLRFLGTAYRSEARLRAAILQGPMGALFVHLRREYGRMSKQQAEELVTECLRRSCGSQRRGLQRGAWGTVINHHGEQGDWNDAAQMLLGEEIGKLSDALQYNRLGNELERASAMLPEATDEDRQVLACRIMSEEYSEIRLIPMAT